jgi:hypothetical protein
MPTFEFTSPDGQAYEVEGPEGATEAQAFEMLQTQLGASSERSAPVRTDAPAPPPGMRGGKVDAFLTGVRDPIDAGAQLIPRGLQYLTSLGGNAPNALSDYLGREVQRVDQMVQGNELDYQAARQAQGREGFDAARAGGNVAVSLIPATKAAQAASKLSTLGRAGVAVPVGAGFGLAQPVVDPEADFAAAKGEQALVGAVLGPVAELSGAFVSKTIAPKITDAARKLADAGVKMTPGQMLGGVAKSVEDAATSVPILGDAIIAARKRSLESFDTAVANRALGEIGQTVPKGVKAGRDLFAYTKGKFNEAYDALLPKLTFNPDQQLATELRQIRQKAGTLAEPQAKQFDAKLRDVVARRMAPGGGVMDGKAYKAVESDLNKLAKDYSSSSVTSERELGALLGETLESFKGTLIRSNPNRAQELAAINRGYANFATFRTAAGKVGTDEGVFTPAQLQNAVRANDKSVGKARFASGNALMQDLSDAGKSALPSSIPDSGTARRLLTGGIIGGGALPLGVAPEALAATLGLASLYTRPGQNLLQAYLTPGATRAAVGSGVQRNALAAIPGLLPLAQE